MRLDAIMNSMVFFILGIIVWVVSGFIMQGLEPTIVQNQVASPQWFDWYSMYQTVYNWTPMLILLATVIYLFTNRTASNEQREWM